MANPYRAPPEPPPPPGDPMRNVLIATGAIAVCGAIVVLVVGLSDRGSNAASAATPIVQVPQDASAPGPQIEPTTLAGICHGGWCWEDPLPTGDDLVAVSASRNDTWIAGSTATGSTLLHWNGSRFTNVDVAQHVTALGRAGRTIWATTHEGSLLRSAGAAFAEVDLQNHVALNAIAFVSDGDGWAVGESGVVFHWDGARWLAAESPTKKNLFAVRARAADDVWAAGDGVILRWNGHVWSVAHEVDEGPTKREIPRGGFCGNPRIAAEMFNRELVSLRDVMPLGPKDVWFHAGSGRAIHWNGATWTDASAQAFVPVASHVSSPQDAWAVDHAQLAHWDGTSWTTTEGAPRGATLTAIDGDAPNDLWAVGGLGRILHYDGTEWKEVGRRASERLAALWLKGGAGWAGGDGALAQRDASGWHAGPKLFDQYSHMNAIGGTSASDLWGFAAFHQPFHFDGKSWTEREGPKRAIFSIAAAAPDDVWGFGALSLVHWDGTRWKDMSNGDWAIEDLWAPAKDVAWATARPRVHKHHGLSEFDYSKLVLLRWNGREWKSVGDAPERGIGGTGTDDVWLGGAGLFHRAEGGKWTELFKDAEPVRYDRRIEVLAPDDVWLSGGTIRHWDGTAMHGEPVPLASAQLVVDGRDLYAFGTYGGIVRRAR